jgi:hypothetical protein
MIIENITSNTTLRLALDKVTRSQVKRGVSILINTESDEVGTVTVMVSGKRGTAQKIIMVTYNPVTMEYTAYSAGKKYTLLDLSEISTVTKGIINNLSTTLLKV